MSGKAEYTKIPQNVPGADAATGYRLDNGIPLSIFPIQPDKFCFCFCGLPGRGKTHIARRLALYLSFFHAVPVEIFDSSEYRRKMCSVIDSEWFDPQNKEASAARDLVNKAVVDHMVEFLNKHTNGIAIMDSTNPTHKRRINTLKAIQERTGAKVMFIEVINENVKFLDNQCEVAATLGPDYAGQSPSSSILDYRRKIDDYKSIYETLNAGFTSAVEKNWTYMQCDHSMQHFVVNNVKGHLQQRVVNFIMNLRTTSHSFYLSRHGQSEYNDLGRIGGDSGLSEHGVNYAKKLAVFVEEKITHDAEGHDVPARLWTSTMRRTKETTQFINTRKIVIKPDPADPSLDYEWVQMRPRAWHHLDELFAGSCDGMTYEEIEEQFPEEWERRAADKLAYRYPRGESYLDVIARLEPIIIEMERHQEPLLIVAHQGILRIIYAFYKGNSRNEAPFLSIPLNEVIELTPGPVTCTEQRFRLYSPEIALTKDGQDEPMRPSLEDIRKLHDPPSH